MSGGDRGACRVSRSKSLFEQVFEVEERAVRVLIMTEEDGRELVERIEI